MLTRPWTGILRLYVWLFGMLCIQVSEQQVQPSFSSLLWICGY